MKKLFILLLVATLGCTNSFAQLWNYSKPDKRVTLGVRAGVNRTEMQSYDDTKFGVNFHGGVVVDYNIVKSFALETGLSYSSKRIFLNWYNQKIDFPYIQLPLLAIYRYYFSDNVHLQFKSGYYIAYNFDDGIHYERRIMDGGIIAGVGLSFHKWYVGVHHEQGVRHVLKYGGTFNTLTFSIGYDF